MQPSFAYFGTPYVARDTLALLVEHGYTPSVVITSPDAPRGRGMELTPCETKAWALEHDLPVLTPEKLTDDVFAEIAAYGCELAVVVAYGKILPKRFIEQFPKGVVNIHYSLLPKYRGASPVEAALLHGDAVTGVTIQKMVYELDAGDILAQREVAINDTETTRDLRPRLISEGAALLIEMLPTLLDGTATGTPQDAHLATHSGKIDKAEGELSLSGDATLNWNKYRAYAESPGTYFFMEKDGKRIRVKLRAAELQRGMFTPTRVVPEGKNEQAYDALLGNGWKPL